MQIKREKFLSEMEQLATCQALINLIEARYPKASKKRGRPS